MSDYTLNDNMVEIQYDLDDREIYNDIRSQIGTLVPETVVDADATYSWKYWKRTPEIPPTGFPYQYLFTSSILAPISWEFRNHSAWYFVDNGGLSRDRFPYYDYKLEIIDSNDVRTKAVEVTNTGSRTAHIRFELWYKYLSAEKITHEEMFPVTLTVRATDSTSIRKYGRRVMNLTWSEGTEEDTMQSLVENYLARYKEPAAKLKAKIKGNTDALRTQIFTREISDIITVVCDNLGLNADFYIDAISIRDTHIGIPECIWELEEQRTEEALTLFLLDTSLLDGAHVLGA
jgi:hypothetical protein